MPIRLTIASDLFGDRPKHNVIVRDDVAVRNLVTEIIREFSLQKGSYVLLVGANNQRLDPNRTLADAGVQQGNMLTFALVSRGKTRRRAVLRADTGQVFDLRGQISIIGRPKPGERPPEVDLTALDTGQNSSRPHALIREDKEQYYVESIRADNLTYVNDKPVLANTRQALRPNDRIRFGKKATAVVLTFALDEG